MAKQSEFRKYLPLDEWFRKQPVTTEQLELTFDQVEEILGTPLPASAARLTTWWTNVQPKIQSHRTAWLDNGWKVAEFDLPARRVRFVRKWDLDISISKFLTRIIPSNKIRTLFQHQERRHEKMTTMNFSANVLLSAPPAGRF